LKELEALKDYIVAKFEEVKNKLATIENTIEDYKEAKITEKNVINIQIKPKLFSSSKIYFLRKQWILKYNYIIKMLKF